jgi:hypothetical protein
MAYYTVSITKIDIVVLTSYLAASIHCWMIKYKYTEIGFT